MDEIDDVVEIQCVLFSTKPLEYPLVSEEAVTARTAAGKRIDELLAPLKKERESIDAPYQQRLFDVHGTRIQEILAG